MAFVASWNFSYFFFTDNNNDRKKLLPNPLMTNDLDSITTLSKDEIGFGNRKENALWGGKTITPP